MNIAGKTARIAAVVSTHQECYPLFRCLASLIASLHDPQDLIFVDNGSSKMLGSWTAQRFPGVTILRVPHNSYFCGGYNAGIRLALARDYDFVLIANADTVVTDKRFLSPLLEAAQRWPRAAFIGPVVYYRSSEVLQKTCLSFPDVFRSLVTWLPWRVSPGLINSQPRDEGEVDFLNGVCVLCRVSALREIGLMDETFAGYVEDADWSWRAKKKGWSSVFTPIPSVIHYEQPDGYEVYSLKTFLLKRNTVLWFLKAGLRTSARAYARSSLILAFMRMKFCASQSERILHRRFIIRLKRAYDGLLRSTPPGEWFGPPFARWEER